MVQPKKALFMIHVRTMAKAPPEANPLSAEVEADQGGLGEENPQHLRPGSPHGAQDADFAFTFDYERAE